VAHLPAGHLIDLNCGVRFGIIGEPASTPGAKTEVSFADFFRPDSPTSGIQEAIDALPPIGGVVTLPRGEYPLRSQIVLRSGVMLQGAGPGTILHKPRYAESRLASSAEKGTRSVQLASAEGFAAGDQVAIRDAEAMGWNVVQAIVTEVRGNDLLLDRPLPRTCSAAKRGLVAIAFPAITGNDVSNVVLKDFVVREDNRRDLGVHEPLDRNNTREMWSFVLPFPLAAIHLVDATEARLERVTVAGWLSDGISLQRGSNNAVVNCLVEKCSGKGIHAGGGLHDCLFIRNVSRRNDDDGFYFCARTQKLMVRENTFIENRANGIGGLGDDGDHWNVVAANLISGNGRHGVEMSEGESNTVIDNTVSNNSQSAPGEYSGIWLSKTARCVLRGNRIFDDQPSRTQRHGIEELSDCRENQIEDNACRDNREAGVILAKDHPTTAAPRRRAAPNPLPDDGPREASAPESPRRR
jgi:parallel beta-helix repeat protein